MQEVNVSARNRDIVVFVDGEFVSAVSYEEAGTLGVQSAREMAIRLADALGASVVAGDIDA